MMIRTAVFLGALALPALGYAMDTQGLYGFGGVGTTLVEGELAAAGQREVRDATAASLRAGVGYRWSRHVAVEAGAHSTLRKANLGSLGRVSSYGMRGAVLGIVPLGNSFELFGKLSLGNEHNHWGAGAAKPYKMRMRHTNVGLGLGARYRINNATALRLDIDSLSQGTYHAGPTRGELSIGSVSLGLQYQF